jgi:hypothetical protein
MKIYLVFFLVIIIINSIYYFFNKDNKMDLHVYNNSTKLYYTLFKCYKSLIYIMLLIYTRYILVQVFNIINKLFQ